MEEWRSGGVESTREEGDDGPRRGAAASIAAAVTSHHLEDGVDVGVTDLGRLGAEDFVCAEAERLAQVVVPTVTREWWSDELRRKGKAPHTVSSSRLASSRSSFDIFFSLSASRPRTSEGRGQADGTLRSSSPAARPAWLRRGGGGHISACRGGSRDMR